MQGYQLNPSWFNAPNPVVEDLLHRNPRRTKIITLAMKVNNENISFIIQGPIIQPSKNSPFSTVNSINNLRHIFPKSEIIVSTWENTHINNIDYDHIVLSKDPGAISFTKKGITYNNVNRQIVSTLAGLRVATRPYVVKMRGDILVTGKNFISISFLGLRSIAIR